MNRTQRLDWAEARARLARAGQFLERSPEDRERIRRERAERLARPPQPLTGRGRTEAIVIVGLGSERFALPLAGITEVIRNPRCAPAPLAPAAVAGVIQVRGEIRPVFHLSRLVNLPDVAGEARAVLLARRGEREAGLLVERVEDIRPEAGAERRPAPPGMPHVLWLTVDLIPVLDPDRIFPEEMA